MTGGESGGELASVSTVYVESWTAIVLDDVDGTPQRLGARAEEDAIPAALRRRLGPYARMAVSCGLGVSSADADIVFCSRYGDVHLAYRLLADLVEGGLLSPAGFSLSVHNAVPGVMDLARKSRVGHTAVAAGTESLSAGLCEAWGKLSEQPETKVTVLYAEYALPEIYRDFSASSTEGIALALSLSARRPAHFHGCLKLERGAEVAASLHAPDSEILARALVGRLDENDSRKLHWQSRGLCWSYSAGSDAAS